MNRSERTRARLRGRIFGAVGVSAALVPLALSEACGGIAVVDSDGAGGTSSSSATQSSVAVSTSNVAVSTSVNATSVSSGSGMFDECNDFFLGSDAVPPNACDYEPGGWLDGYYCFAMPPGGCDAFSEQCIRDQWNCGFADTAQEIGCGPVVGSTTCCYVLLGDCPIGRPLTVAGAARLATVEGGVGWAAAVNPQTAELSASSRAALTDIWLREGLAEHASVASFSRFVLQLLAMGAPAELIEQAQRACLDETEHARICFGLASAYAGRPLCPGPLDLDGVLDGATDREAILLAAAAEGCIAETVSAMIVATARDAATDPAVKQALTTIADEEVAHAELAWRCLRWSLQQPGDQRALRGRLHDLFRDAASHVGCGVVTELAADAAVLRAHGYLSLAERRAIAAQTLAEVVLPAAEALLALPQSDGLGSSSQAAGLALGRGGPVLPARV